MEAGCGTIASCHRSGRKRIRWSLSEASDGHSGNAEDVVGLLARKGKATRRFCPNVMKARRPALSIIRALGAETYHSLLEEYVSPKHKEELFQEAILDSIWWFVRASVTMSLLSLDFPIFERFCWESDWWCFCRVNSRYGDSFSI